MGRHNIYLESYLEPLEPYLTHPGVTDIYVNKPEEIWIEVLGNAPERRAAPRLNEKVLARLVRQVAALNAQGISREHPILSGTLPDGSRIQIVLPPATRGNIALAIRRHVSAGLKLQDYAEAGAFENMQTAQITKEAEPNLGADDYVQFLQHAVRYRQNILISGGTSTGKTTFLNALLHEIPEEERIILIEDTAELQLVQNNAIGLLAVRGALGEASITTEDLLIASLRMRPDRIILGEMRGKEAITFLRAINTGHPGSLSTIHADSPERAIDQLALLVLQSGVSMNWDEVVRYIRHSISLVVQLERRTGHRGIARVLKLS